jgi:ribosomal protein S18 acetylase RimI-like enzyme
VSAPDLHLPQTPMHRVDIAPLDRDALRRHLGEALAIDARVRAELGDAYSHETWGAGHFLAERPCKWRLSTGALREGRLVGFVVASRDGAGMHMHRVAVEPGARGRTGSALLRASEAAAGELGLRWVTLSVAAANERAIRFYRGAGYRQMMGDDLTRHAAERALEVSGGRIRVDGHPYYIYRKALAEP